MPSPTISNRPLKIGLVFDDSLDRMDGVQQYVRALGAWFTAQGHEVHYLVGHTIRTDLPHIHSLSHNVGIRFNGNHMTIPLPANYRAVRDLCRREQFDILHVQMPYSPFLAGRIIHAAPADTVIVGTFHILPHSGLVKYGCRMLARAERRSLRRMRRIFAVSTAAQQFVRQTFGLPSSVLPNVIKVAHFHTARPLASLQSDRPTVLFLGRLVPRKGCLTLLKATTLLRDQGKRFQVIICGSGPLDAELKRYVAAHKLEAIVRFTGFVPEADKPRYFASADIAVFPSSGGESFGVVLLEAMATGRSVVLAARNPGYESVLYDHDELLFEPHNSIALADRISHFLHSPSDRRNVLNWQNTYVRQFDSAVVGRQLLDIYEEELRLSTKA